MSVLEAFPAEINCCSGLGTRTASDASLAEHQSGKDIFAHPVGIEIPPVPAQFSSSS